MSAVMKDPQHELRPMRDEDLERVVEIEHSNYPFPWTRKIFSDCLRVGYSCWVLTVEGRGVAGYGILSSAVGEAHILNLCIDRSFHGMGLGTRMLQRLIDLARWHHAKTIFLEVRPSNTVAVRLYERSGFSIVGRRPNYYPCENGREDALIMALQLAVPEKSG